MVCRHWIRETITIRNIETGQLLRLFRYVENKQPYHIAIHRLEHFLSRILTANFRKSWVLNNLLNHSRFTPFYWRLKKIVFRADEIIIE